MPLRFPDGAVRSGAVRTTHGDTHFPTVTHPRHSYQIWQGCRLELGGAVVRCSHCGTADGARRESDYEVARCAPPAALNNNNGVLTCAGVPNAAGIPEGSYRN